MEANCNVVVMNSPLSAPDLIWLRILSELDFQSIVIISSTCRRFNNLCKSKTVWQHVDFTCFKRFELKKLKAFLNCRHLPVSDVESLRWEGFVRRAQNFDSSCRKMRLYRKTVTQAALYLIAEKCPKLKRLQIVYGDLVDILLEDFPATMQSLSLEGSIIPFQFFEPLTRQTILPNLRNLNLNQVHNLSSLSRGCSDGLLARAPQLHVLRLRNCFKLSSEYLGALALKLGNIRILDLSYSSVIDENFCALLRDNCPHLIEADFSFCCNIGDPAINRLAQKRLPPASPFLLPLRRLSLVECCHLTDTCLQSLACFPRLEYVNVIKTKLTRPALENFQLLRPGCTIRTKFSENTNDIGDGFWFTDGSE